MTEYSVRETAGERIQVLSRPLSLPGVCAVCGFNGTNVNDPSDQRVFIDYHLDIDYYGRVYWCSACLLQAANNLGWMGVSQVEDLRARDTALESELIVLREQNERLRASLANLLGSPDNTSIPVLLDGAEPVRGESEDSQGATTDRESTQLTLDESVSSEGFSSLSADSSGFDSTRQFEL